MPGKQYETVNTQLECEETLHPDYHMVFCQELIEELPEAAAVIMTQLFFKTGMKSWKRKERAAAKSDTKHLHFRDTLKPRHYIELN